MKTSSTLKKQLKNFSLLTLMLFSILINIVGPLFTTSTPVLAEAADDIRYYNQLVGFKKWCGVTGGGDDKFNAGDLENILDDSDGDHGDAGFVEGGGRDGGRAIVEGFLDEPTTNGVVSCQKIIGTVMNLVTRDHRDETGEFDAAKAKREFPSYLKYGPDVYGLYESDPELLNLFAENDLVYVGDNAWGNFVRDFLDPAIAEVEGRLSDVSDAVITANAIPALNYCYNWSSTEPTSGTLKLQKDGLFGKQASYGVADNPADADASRLFSRVPYKDAHYKRGEGTSGNLPEDSSSQKASIGSLRMRYEGVPGYEDKWYTFGYAQEKLLGGVTTWGARSGDEHTGGLLSCKNLEDNWGIFKNHLELGSDGRVKLTQESVDDAEAGGVVDPGEIGNPPSEAEVTEEQQECAGGEGLEAFLAFFLCPIASAIFTTIEKIQNEILVPYLAVSPLNSDPDDSVYRIWKIVRNISYVLLVVGFMYLVFAETTSFGGEAYQLKRLAPRLVIVTIGISISFFAVGLVVDFFNILGLGIESLTDAIVSGSSQTQVQGGAGLVAVLGGIGAAGIIATVGIGPAFIGIIGLSALLILLAVVATVLVRSVLIYSLVMLAPLAMVAALLPNTEKFFKTWWSYLTKALVMFPLIMLLFAGGKIFGSIVFEISQGSAAGGATPPLREAMATLLSFAAGIVPLVLVPFTFKAAGGALGSMYGALRGGAGKAYGAMMGSEHDPNSVRRQMRDRGRLNRARLGKSTANRIGGTSEGGYKVGFGRFGFSTKGSRWGNGIPGRRALGKGIMKGGFLQKVEAAQASRAEALKPILAMHGGEGSKWLQAFGKTHDGLELAEELGFARDSPEAQLLKATFERKVPQSEQLGIEAASSDFSSHVANAEIRGKNYGGSRAEAVQLAAGLRAGIKAGKINEAQADEIATTFGKSAKSAGNETVALMGSGWWKKGEYLKREKALATRTVKHPTTGREMIDNTAFGKIIGNQDDKRGEADFKTVLRHLVARGGGDVERLEADSPTNITDPEARKAYIKKHVKAGAATLNDAEAPWFEKFLDKAGSNIYYNQRADPDTMIARNNILEAMDRPTRSGSATATPEEILSGGDDGGGG